MTVLWTVRAAPGRPQADESIPVHQRRRGCCKCKKIAGNSLFLYALSEFVFESDLEPFGKQRFLSGWNCFWVRLIRACV